ncbi:hypothetical protein PENTCL1PPCAC_3175, partial [Pristionchus entomophagus]
LSLHTSFLIRPARNLSAKTKSFHRIMLSSLIFVAAVPMLFIVAPFAAAMIYYLVPKQNESAPVLEIANVVIAFHSVAHSLVLILSIPIFRKRCIEV